MVIGGHVRGGDHFDGGDHFGGGTGSHVFVTSSMRSAILDNFFPLISNLKSYQLGSHVCRLP